MTRAFLAFTLVTTLFVGTAAPAVGQEEDTITFIGGGWGHGVGMGQYGAYGLAKVGAYDADQIMRHYYTGVTAGTLGIDVTGPERLWVNILNGAVGVTLVNKQITNPGVPITVTNGIDTLVVNHSESVTISMDGDDCAVSTSTGGAMIAPGCLLDATWDGDADSPTTRFEIASVTAYSSASSTTCTHTNWNAIGSPKVPCQYAHGVMHIRPDNNTASFHLVVEMDVDDYVLGISEMPYYWGPAGGQAALEAQAIAARAYAVHRAVLRDKARGGPPGDAPHWCACHVVDTTSDQRYVGWGHSDPAWRAASNDTAGVVYTHPHDDSITGSPIPIQAFYSSSTFGASEPNEIGFGTAPVPYLRSVPDPYTADPGVGNANATWSKELSLTTIAAALGIPGITTAAVTEYSPSGAASKITFFTLGGSVTKNTRNLRTPLGLLSPQITGLEVPPDPDPDPKPDSVGLHDPTTGLWHLLTTTGETVSFYFGNPLDIPYAGDWDGDGVTTLGLYRQSTGFLFLRNSNTQGIADIDIYYGNPGDLPVAGDWNGDGTQTVGIFRPSEARVYLRNTNTQGIGDLSYLFGERGDVPIAGDWDGDGKDSVALWRPGTNQVFFDNDLDGVTDFEFLYSGARPTDRILAGDWDGDGVDTIGVYRPADAAFYLRDTYTQSGANVIIEMGESFMSPVAGSWGL